MIISAAEFKGKQLEKVKRWETALRLTIEGKINEILHNNTPSMDMTISLYDIFKCYPYEGDEEQTYQFLPAWTTANDDELSRLDPDSYLETIIRELLVLGYRIEISGCDMIIAVVNRTL